MVLQKIGEVKLYVLFWYKAMRILTLPISL